MLLCASGFYSSDGDCNLCPAGSFSSPGSNSVQDCFCNVGYTGPNGGPCTVCVPGTFKDTIGSASPQICSTGTYSNASGMSFCLTCAPFSDAPAGSSHITDCRCLPGYSGIDGGPCSACGRGTYFADSSGTPACAFCEAGKYSDQVAGTVCLDCPVRTSSQQGQTNIETCHCIAGYEGPSGTNGCEMCEVGKYKSVLGGFACSPCPAGTYSDQRGNNLLSLCQLCPSMTTSPAGSVSITACICNEGYTGLDGDECSACAPGKYKAIRGSSVCDLCRVGKFSSSVGARYESVCTSCMAGKYSDQMGATSDVACNACPQAKYSEIGGATQLDACVPCAAGKYSSTVGGDSALTCILCEIGKFSGSAASTVCLNCPAGTYGSVDGAQSPDRCLECRAGKYSNQQASASSTVCTDCSPGFFSNMRAANSSANCQVCGSNLYSRAGSSACSSCPSGSMSGPETPSVEDCLCNVGYVQSQPGSPCYDPRSDCPPGTYQAGTSEHDVDTCLDCDPGKFSDVWGATSNATCLSCSLGTFSDRRGASSCSECPLGANGPRSGLTACLDCTSGYFSNDTGSHACMACEAGSYGSMTAASTCFSCYAGTFSASVGANTSNVCTACPAGTASPKQGQSELAGCVRCPPDTYADAGATLCSVCPPHAISPSGSTSRSDCVCEIGHTGPDGGPCLHCLGGTVKAVNGTSNCVSCPSGTYSEQSAASTACYGCPFGSDSPLESNGIVACKCNHGYFGPDGTPCTECSAGKFKNSPGSAHCSSCGMGRYNPMVASVNISFCLKCSSGKYSRETAAASDAECMDCKAGTYAEASGASQCDDCRVGKYLPHVGSSNRTDCITCQAGDYSNAGSPACQPCSAGTYSLRESSTCILCPADAYASEERSSGCLNCSLSFCEIGEFRTRCGPGSIQDSVCVNCTEPTKHSMFVGHGEYNDTCAWVCATPYKKDCATGLCKRCDPGKLSVGHWSGTYTNGTFGDGEWIWTCQSCPEGGECDGTDEMLCSSQRYITVPEYPVVKKAACRKCPLGLTCIDGSCSLPSRTCPHPDSTVIVGEWLEEKERGRLLLDSCPRGFAKKGIDKVLEEMMVCEKCNSVLNYILDPNDDCQQCPPGLICHGNDSTAPVVAGSNWTVEGSIMRLHSCPRGYKVWPALESGQIFVPAIHAPMQECAVCPEGMECILDRCLRCTTCPAGKYKDTPGTAPCRKCAAGKYNPLIKSSSEALCISCPAGANTGALEGAVSIENCDCLTNMYMTMNRTGTLGMRCFDCPARALCPDGRCGLRNFPSFSCSGIGSDDMPHVVGVWVRDTSEMYRVIDCPIGHQIINGTGNLLQECSQCPEGKYIAQSNDPSYRCRNCPPSARCPQRGKPVFPESEVTGELELGVPLLPKEVLILLIAQSLGANPDMISIHDYDALLTSDQQVQRNEGSMKRRLFSSYKVHYSVWTNEGTAESILAQGLCNALLLFSASLSQIAPGAQLAGANCTGVNSPPAENWQEIDGVFMLRFVCACVRACAIARARMRVHSVLSPGVCLHATFTCQILSTGSSSRQFYYRLPDVP
jgi:hypothetical protein